MTSRSSHEKRTSRRVPVDITAHARIGNRFVKEPLGDISAGGLYLRTKEAAKEGIAVTVALALPEKDGSKICTLVGNVVRVDRDQKGKLKGLGISFKGEQMSKADLDALRGFLSRAA